MAASWKTAWVTGASTGIGRALALRLAKRGIRVAISARSADTLAEVAALDPKLVAVPVDVSKLDDVIAAHRRITETLGDLDLVVLNAGVWHPMGAANYDVAKVSESMTVNYMGVANALQPLIPAMLKRGSGHLALVASVAGYRGLPNAVAYAPSKAAVIALAETLRLELAPKNITVSVINPGFVATPMTAVNKFQMPFLVPVEEAVTRILAGLDRGRFEIAFPWQLVTALKVLRVLPYSMYFPLASRVRPSE